MARLLQVVKCIDKLNIVNFGEFEQLCKNLKILNENEHVQKMLIHDEICHGCVILSNNKKYVVLRDVLCKNPIETAQCFLHIIDPNECEFIGYGSGLLICNVLKRHIKLKKIKT